MDPKQETRRIIDALIRERKSLGWGRSGRLDRTLGRGEGFVSRLLSGKRGMRVGQLFEILEGLDLEAGEFFAWVFGVGYRIRPERLLLGLERRAELPPVFRRIDRVVATRLAAPPEPDHQVRHGASPLLVEVRRLDDLRFSYPLRAREEGVPLLDAILDEIERTADGVLLCDGLSALGSVERALNGFPLSAAFLRRAIGLAQTWRLPRNEADLLQRCSYLVADQGEHALAGSLAAQAGGAGICGKGQQRA